MALLAALIRHGDYHQRAETPSAHQPFPLNENGQAQARAAAPGIRAVLDDLACSLHGTIECSSLLRAWQTARILADELGGDAGREMALHASDALAERCVGSAANLTTAEIEAVIRQDPRHTELPAGWKSSADFRLPFPGAESLREAGLSMHHVVPVYLEFTTGGKWRQVGGEWKVRAAGEAHRD